MAQVSLRSNVAAIEVPRKLLLDDVEEILRRTLQDFAQRPGIDCEVKLSSQFSGDLMLEVRVAALIGTLCRVAQGNLTIVTWGLAGSDYRELPTFARTLPGLVAVQMATAVVTDGERQELDTNRLEQMISLHQGGIVETQGGLTRTLAEFDPQQSRAGVLLDSLEGNSSLVRRRLFEQLLLKFRSELAIGMLQPTSRNKAWGRPDPKNVGSLGALATFLGELHDNGYEHGRFSRQSDQRRPGIRLLRLRKHIAINKAELLSRADSPKSLRDFVQAMGERSLVLMEASVSDFGPGIVDHFLDCPQGRFYQSYGRRALLDRLLLDNLSAKTADPAAGLGTRKALEAAKAMSGYVSLRTGEFWLTRSFFEPSDSIELSDAVDKPLARVAGTHWQFFWPHPV
jgi:hypothetical protein